MLRPAFFLRLCEERRNDHSRCDCDCGDSKQAGRCEPARRAQGCSGGTLDRVLRLSDGPFEFEPSIANIVEAVLLVLRETVGEQVAYPTRRLGGEEIEIRLLVQRCADGIGDSLAAEGLRLR